MIKSWQYIVQNLISGLLMGFFTLVYSLRFLNHQPDLQSVRLIHGIIITCIFKKDLGSNLLGFF